MLELCTIHAGSESLWSWTMSSTSPVSCQHLKVRVILQIHGKGIRKVPGVLMLDNVCQSDGRNGDHSMSIVRNVAGRDFDGQL